ncbi:MAG: TIGR01777 family oxidoreductase [Draconibacterium sp.]|nr:TIGR01777 family oxidoreductase [Draconibacterium sp.]
MKIRITGISGYLGKSISEELQKNGHEVFGIERKLIYGSLATLSKEIEDTDVIINLAGAPILQRWSERKKRLIHESRVRTTRNLIAAINALPKEKQPKKLISASAIGIYKSGFLHDESSSNFDEGFVGKVVQDWENASSELPSHIQKNILRIGLVLGKNAKTITNLLLPFKLGLGAIIGNGKQSFPFIHEKDVISAFIWAVEGLDKNGIFNLVAPESITNKDFTKALAKTLNRPAIFSIPEFVLKMVLGEAAVLLTESPAVEPRNLLEAGFEFRYPDITSSLSEILITGN